MSFSQNILQSNSEDTLGSPVLEKKGMKTCQNNCRSGPGFLNFSFLFYLYLHCWHLKPDNYWLGVGGQCGVALCIGECLSASLASTYLMSVAYPYHDHQNGSWCCQMTPGRPNYNWKGSRYSQKVLSTAHFLTIFKKMFRIHKNTL